MRSRGGKVHIKATAEQLRLANVLLDESLAHRPLDLPAAFGNFRPVEVEIGPGKGAFLLQRAGERPDLNFLGIEWLRSYALYAADRARRRKLTNIRLLCADAAAVIHDGLADATIQRVHIYFPDPWPKRKHHRRRLIKAPFLTDVRRVLRLGGWLGVATDHAGYFRHIRMALAAAPGLAAVPLGRQAGAWLSESNFERKYTAAGRALFTVAAIRYA